MEKKEQPKGYKTLKDQFGLNLISLHLIYQDLKRIRCYTAHIWISKEKIL